MKTTTKPLTLLLCSLFLAAACSDNDSLQVVAPEPEPQFDGQQTFRYDTYGDEALWTDVLRYNEVVATISPETALAVGLKVDAEAVPAEVLASADLTDPATTVALLELDAVVGVKAEVAPDGSLSSFGITCALCHSDVDDSVAPGSKAGAPACTTLIGIMTGSVIRSLSRLRMDSKMYPWKHTRVKALSPTGMPRSPSHRWVVRAHSLSRH